MDRPRGSGGHAGDAVFDHPTPLGDEPTLLRLLESLHRLESSGYSMVVVVGSVAEDLDIAENKTTSFSATRLAPKQAISH